MEEQEALQLAKMVTPGHYVHVACRYTQRDGGHDVIQVTPPDTPPGAVMWNVSGWEVHPDHCEDAIRHILGTYRAPRWIRGTIWGVWSGLPIGG